MLAARDAGREPEPSERDAAAAAAAAWAALAAENDRLRRENAQLRRARPKVPRALTQLAPYNTPGPRSAATPTTSALVAPRRRKLLAAHPSVVSSDDESAPNVAALPEVGAALADPKLLYERVSEAEVLASKDDAEQNLGAELATTRKELSEAQEKLTGADGRGKSFPRRKELISRFTGVFWVQRDGRWRAAISVRGSRIPLGEFDDEEDAARVYDAAVVKYRRERRVWGEPTVNFPGEVPLASVLAALPPPPPPPPLPVLGERPPDHVLLRPNEQGDELPSEDEDEAPTRLRSKPRDPPRKRKSPPVVAPRKRSKKCHAGLTTSLHIALADERWNALEKWTFAHAADPYPSAEDKAELAQRAGLPPGTVHHWFSNMRKRKYLKLRDGRRAPRDAFEAQLYEFMPVVQATDADEEDPARALASDPAAFRELYQRERAPEAHPEATIAPAPSPAEPARAVPAPAAPAAAPAPAPAAAAPSMVAARRAARSAAKPAATLSGDSLAALPPPVEHVAARVSVAPAPAPSTQPRVKLDYHSVELTDERIDFLMNHLPKGISWHSYHQRYQICIGKDVKAGKMRYMYSTRRQTVSQRDKFKEIMNKYLTLDISQDRDEPAGAASSEFPDDDDDDEEEEEDDDAFESRSRQTRKRKRDATGHFAARKKAGGRVPKQAVPNEREWAEFRAKRGAPLHDLLDLFADSGDEEE